MEFTDANKNPKILLAAVYPAIATEPNEFTEDLQKDIRKIDHRTLDSGRNSYLKNLL